MSLRAKYRWKAIEALKAAEEMHDPGERAAMLQVATGYVKLSDHVGVRHERGTAHRLDVDQSARKDS
jgi:hypothetical protein